jgi:hypothetical protein
MWLEKSLQFTRQKDIVISHHAPSVEPLPETFREDIVSSDQLEYWIHGLIYEPAFYTIGATQIVRNPSWVYK